MIEYYKDISKNKFSLRLAETIDIALKLEETYPLTITSQFFVSSDID
jgi:hypothetical protein